MNGDIDSPFIKDVYDKLAQKPASVLAVNFPYIDRGGQPSEGLTEEVEALQSAYDFLLENGNKTITIIAKSLGGIVTSFWLEENPQFSSDLSIAILGYVIPDIKTKAFSRALKLVIQGELDNYGITRAVKSELSKHNVEAEVVEIIGADHSYRNPNIEPEYQAKTIKMLIDKIAP